MDDQSMTDILWRGRALIVVSLFVSVGLAALVTSVESKVYQAKALIQVISVSAPGKNVDPVTEQEATQGLATTYATLISSPGFLARIRSDVAGGKLSINELNSRISADAITTNTANNSPTNLIQLKAEGPSPEAARSLADDVAHGFLRTVQGDASRRSEQQQQQIQQEIRRLSGEIYRLKTSPDANAPANVERLDSLTSARTALSGQLATLVANAAGQAGSVAMPSPPYAPSTPIRPRRLLNFIGGVLIGLLVGCGAAWLRSRLDRGLHSAQEAEKLLNVPVLVSVPERKRHFAHDPVLAEAYDVLRVNLAFLSVDQELRVVTFTSFNPQEGKTSTVEGLAYAAVRGGMDVVVIDADVRTGVLSTRFGCARREGLSDVIVGNTTLESSLVEVDEGLSLLPAGRTPPNPPSLLASSRMKDLIEQLRDEHSLVIIDSPPVQNLADPSILAALSDGVVLVGRVRVTKRADLLAAAANLRHTPTPVVGVVVVEPRPIAEAYYAKARVDRPLETGAAPRR